MFSPDSIDTRRSPPPLVITRMAINDQAGLPPLSLPWSGPIRLIHSQNMLEFEFVFIDIDVPALYQYQLEGLEKEWVHPKDRRYVRYTGLPPGEYVFRVRASSAFAEWPDQEIVWRSASPLRGGGRGGHMRSMGWPVVGVTLCEATGNDSGSCD